MKNLKDVMSPDVQKQLKMYRKGVLSILKGLRSGVMDNQEAALSLIRIHDAFAWKIETLWLRCRTPLLHFCFPCSPINKTTDGRRMG